MNRRALLLALGLLLAVNVLVLLGVTYNRGGQPEAQLLLTERELPICWESARDENSGVSLCLNISPDNLPQHWFDADKLRDIGFDVPDRPGDDDWSIRRILPKKAYVVLEYDGESWHRYRRRQLELIDQVPGQVAEGRLAAKDVEKRQEEMRFALGVASRLLAVDVGADPELLRQRYPDRSKYLILAARLRMDYDWRDSNKERRLIGHLDQVLVDRLHVDRDFARWLEALPGKTRIHPNYTYYNVKNPARVRYQVGIAVGRRLEPWITAIEPYQTEAEGDWSIDR
jgi:hypothetical protein